MRQVFNFNPGPGMLPEEVLIQAQAEMLDWHGTGMSIMELGHRGVEFKTVVDQCEADLRELMAIPTNYKVLIVAGGATTQFAMVPINLLANHKQADYVSTGVWSRKAVMEAKRYGDIQVVAEVEKVNGLWQVPEQNRWSLNPNAAYVHYTPNETIDGVEFQWVPKTGNIPLVADMTSMILSREVKVTDYGIIYAGTQKNMGQAGITVVIIRDDLIRDPMPGMPTLYSYKILDENDSIYNTPPTYAWYIMGLEMAWLKRQGGVKTMEAINRRKAKKLYEVIDEHKGFYINQVHPDYRSIMNVVFSLYREELTAEFLNEARELGLANLKGHKLAGGVRASIYNAMPEAGVDALVEFMQVFCKRRG